jgi:O-antigen/teichoic acid export membrane protein
VERVKSFLRDNKSFRGFLHVLSGNALLTVSQGLQFFILARSLGPTEFGRVAAASGLAALLAPFSGLGAANVMIMRGSREPALLPVYFGNALLVMAVTGSLLVAGATLGTPIVLGDQVSVALVAVSAVSELLSSKLVDVCWHAFIARDQLQFTSRFMGMHSVARLAAALIFVTTSSSLSAMHWAWWALTSNTLVSIWCLKETLRAVGPARLELARIRADFWNGVSFAIGIAARSFYTDADKIFLTRYAGAEAVGQYTMAFRVVQIVMAPVRAISFSLQAKLFRAGEAGIEGALSVTLRLLGPLMGASLVLAAGFYVSAPLLSFIAGPRYEESVIVLRALCLMPLLLALQAVMQDTLVTSGSQRHAASSQVVAAIAICLLCVALIPDHGWRGAVFASYAAQLLLSLSMAFMIYRRRRASVPISGDLSA